MKNALEEHPGAPAYGGVAPQFACAKHVQSMCTSMRDVETVQNCAKQYDNVKTYATAKRFMNCMCSVCVQYATAISISMGPVRQRWEPLQ